MIHTLSVWLTKQFLQKADRFFMEKQEIYEYGVECFITDLIQVLWLFIIAFFMRSFLSTFLFSISFALVKKNVGGAHANSHFACIFTFSSLCVLTNLLVNRIPKSESFLVTMIMAVMSALLIFFLAPTTHKNHPKAKSSQLAMRKKCLLFACILVPSSLIMTLLVNQFFLPVSFGIFFASFTLLFAKGGERAWKKTY